MEVDISLETSFQLFTDTFEDEWDIFVDVHSGNGKGKTKMFSTEFEIHDIILSVGGMYVLFT